MDRINRIKNRGITDQITVEEIGINGKLNEISSAFGLALLPHIDKTIISRKNIDQTYRKSLQEISGITCIRLWEGIISNYGYFPILVEKDYPLTRDQLFQTLCDAHIYANFWMYRYYTRIGEGLYARYYWSKYLSYVFRATSPFDLIRLLIIRIVRWGWKAK